MAVPEPQQSLAKTADIVARFGIDRVRVSGGDERARAQIETLVRHHERQLTHSHDAMTRDLRDIEFITSRLADREMQVGDHVPTAQGNFSVTHTFVGGGAYIALLEAKDLVPKLVCRGTAFRRSASEGYSSGLNNVLLEMGARGVRTLWPRILEHVCAAKIPALEVMGKSLGGACAQELAVLLEAVAGVHVVRLVTCGSVGVGAAINALFVERVLANRAAPFRMLVLRNGGAPGGKGRDVDYIPTLGGEHLGLGTTRTQCDIDVCYLGGGEGGGVAFPRRASTARMASLFLTSFWAPHCRQHTLSDVVHHVSVPRDDVDAHLAMGKWLEPWRRRVAGTVAWGWRNVNPTPLAHYIEECTRRSA